MGDKLIKQTESDELLRRWKENVLPHWPSVDKTSGKS